MSTGPDERAGRGRMRAGHDDREQVIAELKAAFVQGQLTKDELDARAGQAFAARTYADLAALTTDLSAGLRGAVPPRTQAGRPMSAGQRSDLVAMRKRLPAARSGAASRSTLASNASRSTNAAGIASPASARR